MNTPQDKLNDGEPMQRCPRPVPTPEKLAADKISLDNILATVEESRARMNTLTEAERADLEARARARISKGTQIVEPPTLAQVEARLATMIPEEQPFTESLGYCLAFAKWFPIESAPKNGRYILLAGPSGYINTPLRAEICRYDAEYRPLQPWVNHADDSFEDGGPPATLWMPIPAAP